MGETFSAPPKVFQDKSVSPVVNFPYRSNIANEINHSWDFRENMEIGFSPRKEPYVSNLMDFDLVNSKAATKDHEDLFPQLALLRRKVVDEEARCLHLEKEKEKVIMNTIIERDNFLRRMASLQEKNKRLEERSFNLHSDIFGDMGALRTNVQRQQQLLRKSQDPIVAQVQPYKPLETIVEEPQRRDLDKGK